MIDASVVVPGGRVAAYTSAVSPGRQLFGAFMTVLLIVGIIMGVRALAKPAWKKRRAQLAAYAAQRGWTYRPDARPWASTFSPRPFNAGVNRKARDLLSGTMGTYPWVSFEYVYIDKNIGYDPGGNGEVARTYFFSVVALRLGWTIPTTEFIPEGITQKAAKVLGGDDLDVESDAFNRMWRVQTDDERAAHALLTPTMIERLMQADFVGEPFFLEKGYLVHFAEGPRSEYEVDSMLSLCSNFLDLIPAFVREDYAG